KSAIRLEGDLWDLAIVGPAGGDAFGAFWTAAMDEHHIGIFGVNPIEGIPDGAMVVEIEAAGEGDLGTGGKQHVGFRTAVGGEENAAVGHGSRPGAGGDPWTGRAAPAGSRCGARTDRRPGRA